MNHMEPENSEDSSGGRGGEAGRGRERKERVLHTRISETLAKDIRRMAEDLRVPVSNLVRNVLEEAFSVVETMTDSVGDLIEEVVEGADRARQRVRQRRRAGRSPGGGAGERRWDAGPSRAAVEQPEFPEVVGWQPLILNQARDCAACARPLAAGAHGFAGVGEGRPSAVFLCRDCRDARR